MANCQGRNWRDLDGVWSLRNAKNVPFLHGKSFSRVKSFFRAVKCFSMSDPFANGSQMEKHFFHARIMISRGKLFTSWEWDFVQWELELRIFWVFFHVGKMISRLYLATAWEKNHFSFTSEGKIFFLSLVKEKKWRKIIFLHKWKKNDFSLTPLLNKGVKSFFQPMKKHWKKIK